MTLPFADAAVIQPEKITQYLLNDAHEYGASKAAFFRQMGYQAAQWTVLRDDLLAHGRLNPVMRTREDPAGVRYVVEGPMLSPTARRYWLRTVWMLEPGHQRPRLLTAIPLPALSEG